VPDSGGRDLLAREIRHRCRGKLLTEESLGPRTAFGVGGPADLLFLPADLEDLATGLGPVLSSDLPVLPLGGGTNMLVGEAGFRGLVICLADGATDIRIEGDRGAVQAGASLQVFARRCQRAGQTGMEFGSGIPGTVGGAIRGNAGAWGSETLDWLLWLRGVDLASGQDIHLRQDEITYGYRRADLPEGILVMEAAFRLEPDDPQAVQQRMDEMLSRRKASQPVWQRNAGCIFKNPPGASAGQLIDQAGCKGMAEGGVTVSGLHANFMVNDGSASASDVLGLIEKVRERVRASHGVELQLEVRLVGEHGLVSL
jgi:UDP-N-acetylmuramate dehydrogenase